MRAFTKAILFLFLATVISLSSCISSSHPNQTITINSSLDYGNNMAKERGNYFMCGTADLYRKTGGGWKEVVCCTLWGKTESAGPTRYYIAIYNDSIYESEWIMSKLTPSNKQGEYQVFYGGETLYCWGHLIGY